MAARQVLAAANSASASSNSEPRDIESTVLHLDKILYSEWQELILSK